MLSVKQSSKKGSLVFLWALRSILKSHGVYASSTDGIRKKLTEIKHEWPADCSVEVKDGWTMAEKLGDSTIISLEDKPL